VIAIGTDIVATNRVEHSWARFGRRFAERILTPAECERCYSAASPARYLAKRFAAKEALAKALGCGIGVRLSWQDLQIDSDAAGAPSVRLSERAQALAESRGGSRMLLSISDERDYAVAFAALVT
jgi:holo-[acyl-carrier protein] synthase